MIAHRITVLLILVCFALGCSDRDKDEKSALEGSWVRLGNPRSHKLTYPIQITFSRDSAIFLDRYNFITSLRYEYNEENSYIRFFEPEYSVQINEQGSQVMSFGGISFHRIDAAAAVQAPPYNLIGYCTASSLEKDSNFKIIHLTKSQNQLHARLNNVLTSPEYIVDYVVSWQYPLPPLLIFIGAEIDFQDLVDVYSILNSCGKREATLVTCLDGRNRYRIINDRFIVMDSLQIEEYNNSNPKRLYPPGWNFKDILIEASKDFERLNQITDPSVEYFIQVSSKMDIIEYFALCERLNTFEGFKIIKEIGPFQE